MTTRMLLGVVLLLCACGGGSTAPAASPQTITTVHLGVVGSVSDSAIFIAKAKGYFKAEGIELDMQRFQSAAQMTPALGRGQLDVGAGAPSAGLFNAMAREVPLKIVADKGNLDRGHGYEAMIVRKDLWDRGAIRSPSDLKGRTVALAARNITPEVTLDTFLRQGGLSVSDVRIVPLPFPDMVTALTNGSVDIANVIEPFATLAVSKGAGAIWRRTDEIAPGHQVGVILYSPDFAGKTDLARRFMRAYVRGARDYNDAFTKQIASKRQEVIGILVAETEVKEAALYEQMVMPGIDPNGRARTDSLASDQEWFLSHGAQKEKTEMDRAVDHSFADWAVKQLGRYA